MLDTKDEMQMNELTRYWRDEKYLFVASASKANKSKSGKRLP